jgi:hypothetical protein
MVLFDFGMIFTRQPLSSTLHIFGNARLAQDQKNIAKDRTSSERLYVSQWLHEEFLNVA